MMYLNMLYSSLGTAIVAPDSLGRAFALYSGAAKFIVSGVLEGQVSPHITCK